MILFRFNILLVFCLIFGATFSQSRKFYDNNDYKKKRHELNFGLGASSNCQTDVGGRLTVQRLKNEVKNLVAQYDFLESLYDTDLIQS